MTLAKQMTTAEARDITTRISEAVDSTWALIHEAHERQAHKALGYTTWEAYVNAEFHNSRSRSYQLVDKGEVIKALGGEMSNMLDITARQVQKTKSQLGEVVHDIHQGLAPNEAVQRALTPEAHLIPSRHPATGAMSRQRRAIYDMQPGQMLVLPHEGYVCNSPKSCSMSSMMDKIKRAENNPRRKYVLAHTDDGRFVIGCYDPSDVADLSY